MFANRIEDKWIGASCEAPPRPAGKTTGIPSGLDRRKLVT
jgi:hypothetical protein